MSRQVTDPVIMRISLIVCINRCANDTFKYLFAFAREIKLEGRGELSQSVNMCDINTCMPNWSQSGEGFIILALA